MTGEVEAKSPGCLRSFVFNRIVRKWTLISTVFLIQREKRIESVRFHLKSLKTKSKEHMLMMSIFSFLELICIREEEEEEDFDLDDVDLDNLTKEEIDKMLEEADNKEV